MQWRGGLYEIGKVPIPYFAVRAVGDLVSSDVHIANFRAFWYTPEVSRQYISIVIHYFMLTVRISGSTQNPLVEKVGRVLSEIVHVINLSKTKN